MPSRHIIGESPFLKRVLIPFWVIRILIMLIDVAAYAFVIAGVTFFLSEYDDDDLVFSDYGTTISARTILALLCVMLTIIAICLILDVVCIVKRARRTLQPKFFLVVNVVQTTVWTVLFILAMISARTGLTIGIGVIVYLTFLGLLIYAAIVFHKFRTGKLDAPQPAFVGHAEHLMPNGQGYYPTPAQEGYAYSKSSLQGPKIGYAPDSHEMGHRAV